MDPQRLLRHKLVNLAQSLVLLGAMALLLAALGWVIAGADGVAWAVGSGVFLALLTPRITPALVLRMYRAHRLTPEEAPGLYRVTAELARRAELDHVPPVARIPSAMINAFAVGNRESAAIAITDGLLRALSSREVVGVLAHEMSHIRHNDMWVMGLADLFSRLTGLLSAAGQLLLVFSIPVMLFSSVSVNWLAIALLVFAPTISALMQLALSRTREFEADLGAAELTGDAAGLASALARMERYQGRYFEQIFLPGHRVPEPSLLRTHPPTRERIERLMELSPTARPLPSIPTVTPRAALATPPRPRWHVHGVWY